MQTTLLEAPTEATANLSTLMLETMLEAKQ